MRQYDITAPQHHPLPPFSSDLVSHCSLCKNSVIVDAWICGLGAASGLISGRAGLFDVCVFIFGLERFSPGPWIYGLVLRIANCFFFRISDSASSYSRPYFFFHASLFSCCLLALPDSLIYSPQAHTPALLRHQHTLQKRRPSQNVTLKGASMVSKKSGRD